MVRSTAAAGLANLPQDAIYEGVMQRLASRDPRLLAALDPLFPKLKPKLEKPLLDVLMSHEAPDETKAAAGYALGRMKSEEAAKALAELAWIGNPDLAVTCSNALAYAAIPSTADSLVVLMKHQNPEVRWAALQGLGRIGGPTAVTVCTELLTSQTDEPPELRRAAATFLGQIGGASAVPTLVAAMKRYPVVAPQAGDALRGITGMAIDNSPTAWAQWYEAYQQAEAAKRLPPPLTPSDAAKPAEAKTAAERKAEKKAERKAEKKKAEEEKAKHADESAKP